MNVELVVGIFFVALYNVLLIAITVFVVHSLLESILKIKDDDE
jgi:hypothetical protein